MPWPLNNIFLFQRVHCFVLGFFRFGHGTFSNAKTCCFWLLVDCWLLSDSLHSEMSKIFEGFHWKSRLVIIGQIFVFRLSYRFLTDFQSTCWFKKSMWNTIQKCSLRLHFSMICLFQIQLFVWSVVRRWIRLRTFQ